MSVNQYREVAHPPVFHLLWTKRFFREVIDTEGIIARPWWIPEEASSAQPFRVCWIRFMKKLVFQDYLGSTLISFNVRLMKPRKGFTMVTGNKDWGWARYQEVLKEPPLENFWLFRNL